MPSKLPKSFLTSISCRATYSICRPASAVHNAGQGGGRIGSHPTRLLCCGRSLWLRIEFAQSRQDFLCEQRDVRDGILVIQETALAEHQQMAKAADAIAEPLDL